MSKNEFPIPAGLVIATPFIVISIPLIVYSCEFGHLGISNSQEVWGQFGDYLNVWVSLASLIAISMLTYFIHTREQHLQESLQKREDIINRPLIAIESVGIYNLYRLKNIGLGPALDIKTSYKPLNRNTWEREINYVKTSNHAPLGPGHEHEFSEYGVSGLMVAVYSDIWGNKITSILTDGKHEIKLSHDEFSCMTSGYQYSETPTNSSRL